MVCDRPPLNCGVGRLADFVAGNCLFASLSDQLYGTPEKHPEIRASIIEHMRTFRPLFEHYVHVDDVQQRRATRSVTTSFRQEPEDAFEEYLSRMSRNGTYGGEPELVAFCQVFDQDVTVHLPRIRNFNRDSMEYTNEHREGSATTTPLHVCYGGDEVTRAHYDSARSRDGSIPRHNDSPLLWPQDPTKASLPDATAPLSPALVSNRAIRGSRADLSSEYIHEYLQKSKKEGETNLDHLSDKYRGRSPSVTSSQQSASSKRSLDDDDEPIRSSKRTDRRKSIRRRKDAAMAMAIFLSGDVDDEPWPPVSTHSPTAASPPSTQDTDPLSDSPAHEDSQSTKNTKFTTTVDHGTDIKTSARPANQQFTEQPRIIVNLISNRATATTPATSTSRLMSVAQRPKSTIRA